MLSRATTTQPGSPTSSRSVSGNAAIVSSVTRLHYATRSGLGRLGRWR
jgi:hypothetical protein